MDHNILPFKKSLLASVNKAESICFITHINPDGDGLAACLAVQRLFSGMGIQADIVVDDLNLERFAFLDVLSHVRINTAQLHYDLVIVIDLHDRSRLGERAHLMDSALEAYIIDHHEIENDLMPATHSWVEPLAVCTGWMLHGLFKDEINLANPVDKLYISTCLYVTLLNDTNNFTNANTDITSYEFSVELCRLGIKPHQIHRLFMQSRSAVEMKFIGQVLSTIELMENGTILFMLSTLDMLAENNLDTDATSNLTRWVTDIKGVDSVVYFREEATDVYRLSLRSKTRNVHAIALVYGGGGHLVAAGCHIEGKLADLKQTIFEQIRNAEPIKI